MKLDDILFCLTDMAESNDRFLDSRIASPYLSDCMNKQTAAIKEVVSLLRLIRDTDDGWVLITTESGGLYCEATDRNGYGSRFGMIMKEDAENVDSEWFTDGDH